MEALFFRFLARELSEILPGARVEKIFLPAPNIVTIALYPAPGRRIAGLEGKKTLYLHARYGTGRHFLFLSTLKTVQPDRAPATAMRLRKYLRGKRLLRIDADWPRRRLILIPVGDGPSLALDPRAFPALIETPAVAPADDVVWPPFGTVSDDPEIWQNHPQLSPELRRRLGALPRDVAQTLYDSLATPMAEGFYLEQKNGQPHGLWPFSWPQSPPGVTVRRFDTALAAAAAFGEPLAFGEVTDREATPQRNASAAGKRRRSRALAKLDADEARMRAFIAGRAKADALAANLHALDKEAKIAQLSVPDNTGDPAAITLDPSLTILRNMQKFYHLAAKGERGLIAIEARRRGLQDIKKDLQGREHMTANAAAPAKTVSRPRPGSMQGVAAHIYRTSDGFAALRGKNAKANDQLLRLANSFDLWFHVADGPGAHVILRRDHPGREVPRRSLEEAAGLAVLASYAARSTTANVMVALVADVRRIKGAAAGQVSVGTLQETILVRPDPQLETLRESS